MASKVYGMLGLCQKAGKLLSGSEQVEKGIRDRKGALLIIAKDSSERTMKGYKDKAEHAGLPYCIFGEKELLGSAIGKNVRTALLVTDKGFAKALCRKIDEARELEEAYEKIQNI